MRCLPAMGGGWLCLVVSLAAAVGSAAADPPFSAKRCELVPLPEHQVSFQIDGQEQTRWHFGRQYPRPFLFPLCGPSGSWLTRMGHPGAPNHDHHRSVWLAHHDVEGVDFWSDTSKAQVRQKSWYAYRDGQEESLMASVCGWYDDQQRELLEQDVIIACLPLSDSQYALELQLTTRPGGDRDAVLLGQTNFGFLAVRVAKSLSTHFGGGQLTGSGGEQGEAAIFGKRLPWVDYSGPVTVGQGADRRTVVEGITFVDHPDNPRYPTAWHVRQDGWMGASFCMQQQHQIASDQPLVLRYLLFIHRGQCDMNRANQVAQAFAQRPGLAIAPSSRPHRQYEVRRVELP